MYEIHLRSDLINCRLPSGAGDDPAKWSIFKPTTADFLPAMSSRRLADLLTLASATRNIVKRHIDIQLQSVSRAAATSSITKAIKRDFRGAPATSSQFTRDAPPASESAGKEDALLDGKDEDVFYDRSESHSAELNKGTEEFKVPQEKDEPNVKRKHPKKYKPKSSPPSALSKTTNPIQDQYVRKMSTHRSVPSETAGDTTESTDLRKNIDEEVFYDTKAPTKPNKDFEPDHVPQEAALPPSPHDKLHQGINSEYYYDREADPEPKSKSKSVSSLVIPLIAVQNDPLKSPDLTNWPPFPLWRTRSRNRLWRTQ
jgi:hypothetical protein